MKKKKMLTLEDLVKFCENQKLYSFSSKETGQPLCVQVPATFEKTDEESTLLFGYIKAFHTGRNKNGSNVTYEAAEKSLKTMAYKPILADFTTNENGEPDFTYHAFDIDEDGEIIYYEKQIGCFTADEPYLKKDSEHDDRYYVYAKCAIPREYTKAADIIERKDGTKVSVELYIYEMSYDSKEKELLLTDIEVSGCTCLGIDPETKEPIGEGMEGARLDIDDFSLNNNSTKFELDENLKQFIQASVQEALDNKNSKGKEENSQMNKFEELLQKFGKSVEDITFEYEGLDDEALEKAFAEAFDDNGEPSATGNEGDDPISEPEPEINPDSTSDNFASFSVTINGETKTFSCSLVDKLNALYTLVNETYSESDNEWYDIDANEETKEVFMFGFFSGKNYKQKYSVKKDVFSLQGDRVEVFATYLTKDEQTQLESIKSNYSLIESELNLYKEEPDKIEILNNDDYSQIRETSEFVELSKRDNYFSLTKEELTKKLDELLLNFAKNNKIDFSTNENDKKIVPMKQLPIIDKKKSGRYGSMFSR